MRLRTFAVTFSLLTGCVTPPPKPVVEICVLDAPALEGICGMVDSNVSHREPIGALDKLIGFRPVEWEKVQNYIDQMEDYVRHQCR